jgi:hypothetical protein
VSTPDDVREPQRALREFALSVRPWYEKTRPQGDDPEREREFRRYCSETFGMLPKTVENVISKFT